MIENFGKGEALSQRTGPALRGLIWFQTIFFSNNIFDNVFPSVWSGLLFFFYFSFFLFSFFFFLFLSSVAFFVAGPILTKALPHAAKMSEGIALHFCWILFIRSESVSPNAHKLRVLHRDIIESRRLWEPLKKLDSHKITITQNKQGREQAL